MSSKLKLVGIIAFYLAPCLCTYFLARYEVFYFHKLFYPLAVNIPALTNYAFCTQAPESIKSLHLFNILYSFLVPAVFFRKAITNKIGIGVKPVLIAIPLVLFGFLLMFMGFELPSADGAGAYIANFYCKSEFFSFILICLFSAGASAFYLMFFIFTYLLITTKANKALHQTDCK